MARGRARGTEVPEHWPVNRIQDPGSGLVGLSTPGSKRRHPSPEPRTGPDLEVGAPRQLICLFLQTTTMCITLEFRDSVST